MPTAIEQIAQERQEQIEKHGFTLERDQRYEAEELRWAAIYCLTGNIEHWPSGLPHEWRKKIDAKSYPEKLATSGAFSAAEIDRLQSQQL